MEWHGRETKRMIGSIPATSIPSTSIPSTSMPATSIPLHQLRTHDGSPEVLEFALLQGIDPQQEPDLLRAARITLLTPLPPPWTPILDEGAQTVYYYNPTTHHSTWQHPLDTLLKETIRLSRSSADEHSGELGSAERSSSPSRTKAKTGRRVSFLQPNTNLSGEPLHCENLVATVNIQPRKNLTATDKFEKQSVDTSPPVAKEDTKSTAIFPIQHLQSAEIKTPFEQNSDTLTTTNGSFNNLPNEKCAEQESSSILVLSPSCTGLQTPQKLNEQCKILPQANAIKSNEDVTSTHEDVKPESNLLRISTIDKLELHLCRSEADGESDPSCIEHLSVEVNNFPEKNIQRHGPAQIKFPNTPAGTEDSLNSHCPEKDSNILKTSFSENLEQIPVENLNCSNEGDFPQKLAACIPQIDNQNLEKMRKLAPLGPIPPGGQKMPNTKPEPLPLPRARQLGKCLQSIQASQGDTTKPRPLTKLVPPVTSRASLSPKKEGSQRREGKDMMGPRMDLTMEYDTTSDEEEGDYSYSDLEEAQPNELRRPQSAAKVNQISKILRSVGGRPSGLSTSIPQGPTTPSSSLQGASQASTVPGSSTFPRPTHAQSDVSQGKAPESKATSGITKLSSAGTMDLEKRENLTPAIGLKSVLAKRPKESNQQLDSDVVEGGASSKPLPSSVHSTEKPQPAKQLVNNLQNSGQPVTGVSSTSFQAPTRAGSESATEKTLSLTGKPKTLKSIETGITQTAKLTSIRGPQTSGNIQTGENSKNFKPDQVLASQTPKPGSAPGKQAQSPGNAQSGTAPASKTNQSGPAQPKPSQGSKTTTITAPAAAKSVGGKTVQTHSTQPKQSVQTISTQPKQSVQTSTTQPKQSVQTGTSQPKQSVPTSTTQPKQSVQTSTTQATKPVQPRSTQPMKPLQTSATQPAKPTQTSTRQPDVPVPVSSSQPDAEVLSELTKPFGTFQVNKTPVF
ncbi:WW domain [Trinorchestia longiramus]|nr:WW domain [Trinorchestia longiramus]